MIIKFITGLLVVILAVFLQYNVSLGGIAPHFLSAALAALLFFIGDFFAYAALAATAALALDAVPGVDIATVLFIALWWAAFWVKRHLPWETFVNFVIILAALPPLFYLITDPAYLFRMPAVFAMEMVYTIGAGVVFYFILHAKKR